MSRTTAMGLPSSLSALTIVHADDRARHRDHELLWLGVSPDASATDLSITARAEVSLDSASWRSGAPQESRKPDVEFSAQSCKRTCRE